MRMQASAVEAFIIKVEKIHWQGKINHYACIDRKELWKKVIS